MAIGGSNGEATVQREERRLVVRGDVLGDHCVRRIALPENKAGRRESRGCRRHEATEVGTNPERLVASLLPTPSTSFFFVYFLFIYLFLYIYIYWGRVFISSTSVTSKSHIAMEFMLTCAITMNHPENAGLYAILNACWEHDPKKRPKFHAVFKDIQNLALVETSKASRNPQLALRDIGLLVRKTLPGAPAPKVPVVSWTVAQ